jgi:hypothetical protein
MAARAAFERLQPWSAFWLALQLALIQRTSSPALGPRIPGPRIPVPGTRESLTRLVLAHWLRRCAPVTHQDQDLRASRCVAPGCFCSPRKPSVPHRVQSTRPDKPAAQVYGFAQARSNPLWLAVRAQRTLMPGRDRHAACNQVSWFYQPHSDTAAAVPLIVELLIQRPLIPRTACRPS